MAVESYFFNAVESGGVYDRTYTSEDFCSYLDLLVGNGVFPNPSTNLQVSAGSGMQVQVLAGSGWIKGHKMVNTAAYNLTVAAADVTYDRTDRVVFFVDYTNREMGIGIKTGTASNSPSAPSLQRDTSKWELGLATVSVAKQTTSITNSMITDTRGNTSICGWVSALVDQLDSSTLFQQFTDAFETWFEDIQTQLATGNHFVKLDGSYTTTSQGEYVFDVSDYIASYSYAYDTLDVYINGMHLAESEYSQSGSTVTLDVPIAEPGALVNFVIYKTIDEEQAGTVLTNAAKQALIDCFEKVVWTDGNGQSYVDDLENALYN